jgi:hypothetical protein
MWVTAGSPDPVGLVAHLIQTALTPVFLLSGIASLLIVFNTRLARVSDHVACVSDRLRREEAPAERRRLHAHLVRLARRRLMLDASVALGAIGGGSTCAAAFVLFLGSVREAAIANWLIGLFAVALACTVASLLTFLGDSLLAWHSLRREWPLPPTAQQ